MRLTCLHLHRVARLCPKHHLAFGSPIPTFTMALNPPPQKVYDFPEVAIDDINKFAKGQGYAVATFRTKTDKQTPPTVRKIWL
jgi:hypothetical protein